MGSDTVRTMESQAPSNRQQVWSPWLFPLGVLISGLMSAAAYAALPDDGLVDQASEKLSAGDVDGAILLLARAQKAAPKDPRPLYLAGAALQQKGLFDGAERSFKAALALDPRLGEVRGELGALYLDHGRAKEAIVELERALVDAPRLSAAWRNLGAALVATKDCKRALPAYQHAVDSAERDAVSDALVDLSLAERRCDQAQASVATAQKAIAVAGGAGSAGAHLNLGLALSTVGKKDDAVKELQKSTQLDGRNPVAWWSLGLTERERGHLSEAAAALGHAAQLAPTPRHALALSETLAALGRCAEAKAAAASLTGEPALAAGKKLAACHSK